MAATGGRQGATRVRVSGAERRNQIVTATVALVGKYGLQGTTVSRIARAVGVSEMALYRHFESKNEMLVAAFDYLDKRSALWMTSSSHPWVPTRLREIGLAHFDMLTCDIDMWTAPTLQFVVGGYTQTEVAAAYGERPREQNQGTHGILARYLQEGMEQESIRRDVDVDAFRLQWMSWAQGENLHYLLAHESHELDRKPHLRLLDLIISDIELPRDQ